MGNKCPCLAPKTGGHTVNGGKNKKDKTKDDKSKKAKNKDDKNKKKQASKYAMPSEGLENDGFEERPNRDPDEFTNIGDVAQNGDGPKSATYRQNSTEEVEIVLENDPEHERPVDVPGEPNVNYKVTRTPDSNHNDTGDIEVHHTQSQGIISLDNGNEIIDTRLRLPSAELHLDHLTDSRKEQYINPAFDNDSLSSAEDVKPSDRTKDFKVEQDITKMEDSISRSSSSLGSENDRNSLKMPEPDILPDEIDIKFDSIGETEEVHHMKHKTFETQFQLEQENKPEVQDNFENMKEDYAGRSENDVGSDSPTFEHVKHLTYETQMNLENDEMPELENKGLSAYDALMQLQKKEEHDLQSDSESDTEVPLQEHKVIQKTENSFSESDSDTQRDTSPRINNVLHLKQEVVEDESDTEKYVAMQNKTHEKKIILDGAIDTAANETSDFDVENRRESISSVSSDEYQKMGGATIDTGNFPHYAQPEEMKMAEKDKIDLSETREPVVENTDFNDQSENGSVYMTMQVLHSDEEQSKLDTPSAILKPYMKESEDESEEMKPQQEGKDKDVSSDDDGESVKEDTVEQTKAEEVKKPKYPEDDSPDEENKELEEILTLIEKLEDSLVEDLATSQDAESLSRNIVEKLDEISALREQAEMDVPIETIMEEMQEDEDDDEGFDTEDQIIDWYNRRLDELNEAVGMDLLEMSMTKSLSEEVLEPLFTQHAESHTYFIRRRLVELEKLRQKRLVTNQKPLFEPREKEELELHRPTRPKIHPMIPDEEDKPANLPKVKEYHAKEDSPEYVSQNYDTGAQAVMPVISEQTHETSNVEYDYISNKIPVGSNETEQTLQVETTRIMNQNGNMFEESDVDMGPGVNQFVSPSKSEEDLWFKVESLQSKEVISDSEEEDETDPEDKTEIQQKEQEQQKKHNFDGDFTEFEQVAHQQQKYKHDAVKFPGKPIIKASTMYGSDSDSSDESVNEENRDKLLNVQNQNLHSTGSFDIASISNEYEEDNVYSTPSSLPVKLPANHPEMLKQEPEDEQELFAITTKESTKDSNVEIKGKHVIKARMISRSSSDDSSSEDEDLDQAQAVDKQVVEQVVNVVNDESSDDEHIYSTPTSRPVKLLPTEVKQEQVSTEVSRTFQDPLIIGDSNVSGKGETKTKVSMYHSSSEESETEELCQNAYAMEEGVSSSESDVHKVPMMKPQVVQENRGSAVAEKPDIISDIDRDNSPVGEQFGAVEYSDHDVVAPNDIFGEFQSETFDRLQTSQDHANDLLSELQALSKQKHQDEDYFQTFDYSEPVTTIKKMDDSVVLKEKHTLAVETNNGVPTEVYSAKESVVDSQAKQNFTNDTFEYSPAGSSMVVNDQPSDTYVPVIDRDNDPQLDQNVVDKAIYDPPPVDFSSSNMGLMSLAMQPIPPIDVDEHQEIESNIQICSKETGEPYPLNINDGIDNQYNGHEKLARKQSREILLSESSDTDTDELIKAAVIKGKAGQNSDAIDGELDESLADDSNDDTDTEGVIQKYGEALQMKKAQPITPVTSDSDVSKNDTSESEEDDEDDQTYEAEIELRETLKEDIRGSISTLSKDDFAQLMGIYREERAGIKDFRDKERSRVNESLLDKLQRRREAVDQYVHEGDKEHGRSQQSTAVGVQVSPSTHSASVGGSGSVHVTATGVGAGYQSDSEASEAHEEDEAVEESLRDAEELTQTVQLMDMEIVQQAIECDNREDANTMIQEHFDMVELLRKNKDTNLKKHRAQVKARLEARTRKLSSSSSEDSCSEEKTGDKDAFIDLEMDSLKESYLDAITSRDMVTEQELHDIIVQYREDQQDLIRKREFEKLRINEKLRERLSERNNRESLNHQAEQPTQPETTESAKDTEFLSQMSRMDDEFYKELYRMQALGQLDEEEMGHMIEEHLDRADEFRRKVKGEVEKRRIARSKMTNSRKIKQAELIIQTEKEETKKIRQMREQEKHLSDIRLQEKLQRKKKYEDSPALPPPKRSHRNKKSRASHIEISNYENVEFDC